MENLTHTLTGAMLAKAGLEKYSPLATTTLIIAANLPDIDLVVQYGGGMLAYLHHHRGITHSILGLFGLAIILSLAIYILCRLLRSRIRRGSPPVEFKKLFVVSLIGLASHLLLDSTNAYGVRPFLPFSGKWYYGDTFFIVDPWLWVMLGGALFILTANTFVRKIAWGMLAGLLTLLMLAVDVVPLPAKVIWLVALVLIIAGRRLNLQSLNHKLALGVFAVLFVYWICLSVGHSVAFDRTLNESGEITSGETVTTMAAMPRPVSPFSWSIRVETERSIYQGIVSLNENPGVKWEDTPIPKGFDDPVSLEALATCTGRVMMNFARYPFAEVEPTNEGYNVYFRDARYETKAKTGWGVMAVHLDSNLNEVGFDGYCPAIKEN